MGIEPTTTRLTRNKHNHTKINRTVPSTLHTFWYSTAPRRSARNCKRANFVKPQFGNRIELFIQAISTFFDSSWGWRHQTHNNKRIKGLKTTRIIIFLGFYFKLDIKFNIFRWVFKCVCVLSGGTKHRTLLLTLLP